VGEHSILGTKVAVKIINRDKIKEQRFDQKIKRFAPSSPCVPLRLGLTTTPLC